MALASIPTSPCARTVFAAKAAIVTIIATATMLNALLVIIVIFVPILILIDVNE
jgi:hypothetical protein